MLRISSHFKRFSLCKCFRLFLPFLLTNWQTHRDKLTSFPPEKSALTVGSSAELWSCNGKSWGSPSIFLSDKPSNSQIWCSAPVLALEILFWGLKPQHCAGLPWKPQCLLGMAALSPLLPSSLASPEPSPLHLPASRQHLLPTKSGFCGLWRGQEIHVSDIIEVQNSQGYGFVHLQGIQSCIAVCNFHSWWADLRDSVPQPSLLCSMWLAGWYPTYGFWGTGHSSAASKSLNLVCYYLVSLVWKFPGKNILLAFISFPPSSAASSPFELYLLPLWFMWVSHRADPESPKSKLKFLSRFLFLSCSHIFQGKAHLFIFLHSYPCFFFHTFRHSSLKAGFSVDVKL